MADQFEVRYVGGLEAVEEGYQVVRPGETIKVDEERAAHLTAGDAWELVGRKVPKGAPAGEEVAVAVPENDVHANQPADDVPPSGGKDEG